jgi:hypothetical protein
MADLPANLADMPDELVDLDGDAINAALRTCEMLEAFFTAMEEHAKLKTLSGYLMLGAPRFH